jgi:hypothetical protein
MKRTLALLWPLPLAPLFVWLAAEDHIRLGGGDKDIILGIPLALFALIYLPAYGVFWWRGHGAAAAAWRAALAAFLLLLAVWVGLLTLSLAGVVGPRL